MKIFVFISFAKTEMLSQEADHLGHESVGVYQGMYLSGPQIGQFRAWVDQSPSLVHSLHELPHLFMAVHAVK